MNNTPSNGADDSSGEAIDRFVRRQGDRDLYAYAAPSRFVAINDEAYRPFEVQVHTKNVISSSGAGEVANIEQCD